MNRPFEVVTGLVAGVFLMAGLAWHFDAFAGATPKEAIALAARSMLPWFAGAALLDLRSRATGSQWLSHTLAAGAVLLVLFGLGSAVAPWFG